MSYQQSRQQCQLPAKCLSKYPPKCPPQVPQAPASCPAPCPPPASSCCVPTCCISGFGGSCTPVSHLFPRVYLCQPPHPDCCEIESYGCSSCCRGSGGC
ncbi:late cornified envelope protein 7A [Daubentonia madagascariensis]|uniref:Late cornified envelope protein 7A n=1 Tax=Daubentonia madagascariensis TaxID=31869 RepID=A0ABD2DY48_DAUMA